VLLLGSGYVSSPLVEYLLRKTNVSITISSNNLEEASGVVASTDKSGKRAKACLLDVSNNQSISNLVSQHDLVVSLVPATMHASVAKLCIKHKKDMLTASYISPEMQELDSAAKEAGITIMNELGLDPGIDHLTAMRFFNSVKDRGDGSVVDRFVSWCGGLPAPEASDNPIGYC
jgi:alpha-aminoadipic semialdehyde synthase